MFCLFSLSFYDVTSSYRQQDVRGLYMPLPVSNLFRGPMRSRTINILTHNSSHIMKNKIIKQSMIYCTILTLVFSEYLKKGVNFRGTPMLCLWSLARTPQWYMRGFFTRISSFQLLFICHRWGIWRWRGTHRLNSLYGSVFVFLVWEQADPRVELIRTIIDPLEK